MSTPRIRVTALLLAALTLGAAGAALAANPNSANDYLEFRVNSALPGMMFGVTPDGQVGFDGAFQQNIPVAYTPKGGNYVANIDEGSRSSRFVLSTNAASANGTAFLGVGIGGGKHPGYISWEATSSKIEEAYDGQIQVLAGHGNHAAISLGVLDAGDERQEWNPGAPHNARSVYVTATGGIPAATWQPLYWTVGIGNGRFRNAFAGLSVPLANHIKLAAEYDGYGANIGLAYGLNGHETEHHWDVIGYLGYTDLKNPTLGLTTTFN
jgi:hypothetical protein